MYCQTQLQIRWGIENNSEMILFISKWIIYFVTPHYNCLIFLYNKSTASGAKYARSSVIFPHHMAFVRGRWCSEEGAKTKSDKKIWVKGGGGG